MIPPLSPYTLREGRVGDREGGGANQDSSIGRTFISCIKGWEFEFLSWFLY